MACRLCERPSSVGFLSVLDFSRGKPRLLRGRDRPRLACAGKPLSLPALLPLPFPIPGFDPHLDSKTLSRTLQPDSVARSQPSCRTVQTVFQPSSSRPFAGALGQPRSARQPRFQPSQLVLSDLVARRSLATRSPLQARLASILVSQSKGAFPSPRLTSRTGEAISFTPAF